MDVRLAVWRSRKFRSWGNGRVVKVPSRYTENYLLSSVMEG
ncbi:MAG: hypothetical protein UV35_C0011G0016 [candidate division WWE3 bacterium GW2011_GWB1_42_6]|uniref:Uncharacterized protein n=1 Tax=candidate division WWE3 bacterium GW2011_GWB1_42_6 TaxID=1619115 RepID=A0A0G1DW82_UNCKA|nr:MAG: hypothetical protein UV35_C0011G0016 [candidate division WWE3 bacterium GW2011_GWB1_42_6]